jgi:replication factor C subunit 3/5
VFLEAKLTLLPSATFPVVVINEADGLSRDAQSALRRTMEKYMSNLRLILCATSTSRIIAPIRSRCLLLRVGAPSEAETSLVLRHVAKKEKFHLPDEVSAHIYKDCNGNLRKAILVLEALRMQRCVKGTDSHITSPTNAFIYSPDLKGSLSIAKPDWETYTSKTADMIISEQSPKQLLEVRGKLYELLVHAIPARLIIKTLTDCLVVKVDEELRGPIVEKAAMYELRCRQGAKAM